MLLFMHKLLGCLHQTACTNPQPHEPLALLVPVVCSSLTIVLSWQALTNRVCTREQKLPRKGEAMHTTQLTPSRPLKETTALNQRAKNG